MTSNFLCGLLIGGACGFVIGMLLMACACTPEGDE